MDRERSRPVANSDSSRRVRIRAGVVVLAIASVGLVLVLTGAFDAPRVNLILITLDTTRADRLGCYGCAEAQTPNLDRLAAEGSLFLNARVHLPLTLPSHASILTGTNPYWHGLDTNGQKLADEGVVTLAESLDNEGYTTGAVIAAFVLTRAYGLDQGFHEYDDSIPPPAAQSLVANAEIPADQGLRKAIAWLDRHGEERFFLWWHIFDPHDPYEPPGIFAHRFKRNPYDGEIAFVDSVVGELLDALEARNLFDSTVLAVIGDHGESLGEHDEEFHGLYVYNSTLHVPFILRGPGVPQGRRVTELVRSIDLAPTVLELLGGREDPACQGRSLTALMAGRREEPRISYFESKEFNKVYGWAVLRGVERDGVKFMHQPEPELYFLDDDPGELHNLAAQQPQTVEAMAGVLDRIMRESVGGPGAEYDLRQDVESLEKLVSLGYVSGGSRHESSSEVDWKDHRELLAKIRRLNSEFHTSRGEAVEKLLEEIQSETGDALIFHFHLGMLLFKDHDYAAAIEHMKIATRHDHYRLPCALYVVCMCLELKRYDEAREFCEVALEVDPFNPVVYSNLLQIAVQEQNDREVARCAAKLLELVPGHPDAANLQRLAGE